MSKTLSLILLLYSSIFFTTRAGFPAIIDPLGTLFVTTLPAPTIQSSPIFAPGSIKALAPMNVLLYIIDYLERNPDYVDFWENSLASDLMFFQTIIMNSPYADKVEDELMFVNFGKTFATMNHPLNITPEMDDKIEKGKFYCARKFELNEDSDAIKYFLEKTK